MHNSPGVGLMAIMLSLFCCVQPSKDVFWFLGNVWTCILDWTVAEWFPETKQTMGAN
jgi:hypothetical protein